MDGLSDADAFTARELAARGFGAERIAQLLAAAEQDVRAALTSADDEPAPVVESPLAVPVRLPEPAVPREESSWPPPVTEATRWESVAVGRRRYGERPELVRVRWVVLWGQWVRINAAGEVWCHACLAFKATDELGHPLNSCPVGLPNRGGVAALDFSEPDRGRGLRDSDGVDFLRVQW